MHWLDDPIYPGIPADGLMLGIHQNDLEVFICRVLIDPVRIQNPEVGAASADTLLGS